MLNWTPFECRRKRSKSFKVHEMQNHDCRLHFFPTRVSTVAFAPGRTSIDVRLQSSQHFDESLRYISTQNVLMVVLHLVESLPIPDMGIVAALSSIGRHVSRQSRVVG